MLIIIGLILLIAIVAAFAYLISKFMEDEIDDIARSEAPGEFANLPQGITHFIEEGPAGAHTVVLLHGQPKSSYVFDTLVPELTSRGFQTLTYDLYGRGYSDRPKVQQTPELFSQQLLALLNEIGLDKPVTILGYDMGANIACDFTAQYPERVKRLMLVSPLIFGAKQEGFMHLCAVSKAFGDWAMQTLGHYMIPRLAEEAVEMALYPDLAKRQKQELHYSGYLQAVLSAHRHTIMADLTGAFEKLAAHKIPTLALWGEEDAFLPEGTQQAMKEAMPHAVQLTLSGAGNQLPLSHAKNIAKALKP